MTKISVTLPQPSQLLPAPTLRRYVAAHFKQRGAALAAYRTHGAAWLFDRAALTQAARDFRAAFTARLPDSDFFYAIKCNHHPAIMRHLAAMNWSLDVSSGAELRAALATSAPRIVFSGPGKTTEELALITRHAERVTALVDSFGELARLNKIAQDQRRRLTIGVRITPPLPHAWRKFGIPLAELGKFCQAAERLSAITLRGLQFHTSWNLTPAAPAAVITKIGEALRGLPEKYVRGLEFFDLGGGYWVPQGEWMQYRATPRGQVTTALGLTDKKYNQPLRHYYQPAAPLPIFARAMAQAVKREIFPNFPAPAAKPRICFEPGRWIANNAFHLVMGVTEVKHADLAITDIGTNVIGWERFESDYAPILNLSRPAPTERVAEIMGSLCTPHDWWGYSYFGKDLRVGDVLMIPDQGAYTYSLRQEFIKPLIPVVEI